MCRYLTDTGPSLARNITASHKSHRHFLFGDFINSFYFDEISEQEVVNICSTFRSGKATGFVNVSASLMKETITSIHSPLSHISNSLLSSGVVPIQLKIARIVPSFKTGGKSLFSNYRPISILPSFSRILEKLFYDRIIDYLIKYKILFDDQFGFRKQHFIEYALALLYYKIPSVLIIMR